VPIHLKTQKIAGFGGYESEMEKLILGFIYYDNLFMKVTELLDRLLLLETRMIQRTFPSNWNT